MIAFTLAMLIGSAIGWAMGRYRTADRFGDPWLIVLLNLPALVIIVLAYMWAGLTEAAAIIAVALNKLPIAAVTVREGARALDRGLDDMAQVFRMSAWTRMRHVVLPQLAPYLAAAARSGLSLVWKIVLIVELLGRPNGVGFEIGVAFQLFDVTKILTYALAFTAVMLVIETFLVQPLERHVSAGVPRPLEVNGLRSTSRTSPSRPPPAASSTSSMGSRCRWVTARSARWSARRAAARPHCCASSPGSTATTKAASSCRITAGSAWCSRSRGCCRGARSSRMCGLPRPRERRGARRTVPQLGLDAHRHLFPGELSLGLARARPRWRAPLPSNPNCCCSTSRSCRSTMRWRRGCAMSSPSGDAAPGHDAPGDARCRRSHRTRRSLFFLSASPTRVIAEVPVARPREKRTAEESWRHCVQRSRASSGRLSLDADGGYFQQPHFGGPEPGRPQGRSNSSWRTNAGLQERAFLSRERKESHQQRSHDDFGGALPAIVAFDRNAETEFRHDAADNAFGAVF